MIMRTATVIRLATAIHAALRTARAALRTATAVMAATLRIATLPGISAADRVTITTRLAAVGAAWYTASTPGGPV